MIITRMRGTAPPAILRHAGTQRVGKPENDLLLRITRATPSAIPHIPKVETKGLRPM